MSTPRGDAIALANAIHAAHISAHSYRAPDIAQDALAKAWDEGYERAVAEVRTLTTERDEMTATVERVRALADEWDSDTEFAHKAHYADELRDALNGGESDE